ERDSRCAVEERSADASLPEFRIHADQLKSPELLCLENPERAGQFAVEPSAEPRAETRAYHRAITHDLPRDEAPLRFRIVTAGLAERRRERRLGRAPIVVALDGAHAQFRARPRRR